MRGGQFSTYAPARSSRTLRRPFRKSTATAPVHNAADEVFQLAADQRTNQQTEEAHSSAGRRDRPVLEQLDDRERQIIRSRYGLDSAREPMTSRSWVARWASRRSGSQLAAGHRQASSAAVALGLDEPDDRPPVNPAPSENTEIPPRTCADCVVKDSAGRSSARRLGASYRNVDFLKEN